MSETNVARAGKRGNICVGNNVSGTMGPRLPGPLGMVGEMVQIHKVYIHSHSMLLLIFTNIFIHIQQPN